MGRIWDRWVAGAAALVVLLVAAGLLRNQTTGQLNLDSAWVTHTHEVILGLENILSLAKDAESGQRGYLITGDPRYLEHYHDALAAIGQQVDRVGKLTADNPRQQARFPEVRERVASKLKQLEENVALRRDAGFEAARLGVLSGRAKAEMDALRAVIGSMVDEEHNLLRVRMERTRRNYRWANLSGALTGFASVAGVVAFTLLLRRHLAARNAAARALAEESERLRTTIASIGDAVIATDTEGRITIMNGVAESLTGWRVEEARGKPLEVVFHIVDEASRQPAENPAKRALREGVMVGLTNHTLLIAKDGTEWPLDDSAAPIHCKEGEVVGCVLVFREITQRRKVEQALSEADRRKDEFLAVLAHELRSPLAPIRNATEILLLKGPPDPDLRWSREVIDRQVRHMARLLDDLLDVSRISHDKLELRKDRIELAGVVQHAVETSRPLIDAGRHELVVNLPPEPILLDADPVRLAQILSNLLSNAARYSEAGGSIRLAGERRDGEVVISVKDEGVGIAADELPRIFETFSQGERVLERSRGGLGIGLSLVRGLAQLHGGSVEARSEGPGRGAEFVVHLPAAAETQDGDTSPSPRTGQQAAVAKRRILIADDLKDSADTLAMLLRIRGHEIQTTYDGEQAILTAEQFRPQIVLLDIGMPKLNGYAVCSQIRQKPWGTGMFLIALTGWGQEDDRCRTQEAGFDHHLVKPVDPAALNDLLASLPATRIDSRKENPG